MTVSVEIDILYLDLFDKRYQLPFQVSLMVFSLVDSIADIEYVTPWVFHTVKFRVDCVVMTFHLIDEVPSVGNSSLLG